MKTLFELPEPVKKKRAKRPDTQVTRCKNCRGSKSDKRGAYCHRFDLCLEYDGELVRLVQNNQPITCNGKEWAY